MDALRIDGLERAIELWWFFFGPMIAHLFGGLVRGREEELSPMFREYLSVARGAQQINPATLDEFMGACVERDDVRAKIIHQMRDVRILLSPVCLAPAFRHGEGNWQPGHGVSGDDAAFAVVKFGGIPGGQRANGNFGGGFADRGSSYWAAKRG